MSCVDCPHFKIRQKPLKGVDFGLAVCEKHNLQCDYVSKQQLRRLECVDVTEEVGKR